jgi:hypothetical protein
MVREFAAAVSRALPVRDAGEPRVDGAGLVSEEMVRRWSPSPGQWGAAGLPAVYLPVPLVLWFADRVTPLVLWLLGPVMAVIGAWAVRDGWEMKGKAAALRSRGITVEGRLESSYEERSGDETVTKYVYPFADTRGGIHERRGAQGRGAERVEIVYDPENPQNNKVGRRPGEQQGRTQTRRTTRSDAGRRRDWPGRGCSSCWSGGRRWRPGWCSWSWEWWPCSPGPERNATPVAGWE